MCPYYNAEFKISPPAVSYTQFAILHMTLQVNLSKRKLCTLPTNQNYQIFNLLCMEIQQNVIQFASDLL